MLWLVGVIKQLQGLKLKRKSLIGQNQEDHCDTVQSFSPRYRSSGESSPPKVSCSFVHHWGQCEWAHGLSAVLRSLCSCTVPTPWLWLRHRKRCGGKGKVQSFWSRVRSLEWGLDKPGGHRVFKNRMAPSTSAGITGESSGNWARGNHSWMDCQ